MTDVLTMVMVLQVLLIGAFLATGRLRRLERAVRPPCYAQVGALRSHIVALRSESAFDSQEQARRLRDVEEAAARIEDEVRILLRRQEKVSRALLERIGQLEQRLEAEAEVAVRPSRRLASSGS